MRKSVLLAVLVTACVASIIPSDAANQTSGSSSGSGMGLKVRDGFKAVGRGIMWGPKKIGAGMKSMGNKMRGNKPATNTSK